MPANIIFIQKKIHAYLHNIIKIHITKYNTYHIFYSSLLSLNSDS